MSYIFQRTGATHPLDGELRTDPRTGRTRLECTSALPPLRHRLLTESVPPFFIPIDPLSQSRLVERFDAPRRRGAVLGISAFAAAATLGILCACYLDVTSLGFMLSIAAPLMLLGVFALAAGQLGPKRIRVVRRLPTSAICIEDWRGTRVLSHVAAAEDDCAVRLHAIRLDAYRTEPWLGYGVVLTLADPPVGLVVLAAFELEPSAQAYVRDLPPWLRTCWRGVGEPLRGYSQSSQVLGHAVAKRATRLSKGACPGCGYDLTSIGYKPCPECGYGHRRHPRE